MSRLGQTPPPLETVTVPTVDTETAAYYLDRKPGTLRLWACKGTGAVTPKNVNGRLAWPVAKIREALGVSA